MKIVSDAMNYLRNVFGAYFDLILRIVRWTGLVTGSIFLVLTLGNTIRTAIFLHNSVATTGTVASLLSKHGGEQGSVTYAPIFTFSAQGGQLYTVTSDASSNPAEFVPGQSVRVLYRPDNPQDARIATFWQLWTFEFVFGIFGVVLTGLGYGLLRYERWRDRRGLSITVDSTTTTHAPHF